MERWDFCNLCLLAGAGFLTETLSGCTKYAVFNTIKEKGVARIPLALFENQKQQIVRISGVDYDVAVTEVAKGEFKAVVLKCSHAAFELLPNGDGYECPNHGSTFNADGVPTKGPAEKKLTFLKCVVDYPVLKLVV
jgi:Rieske Fe-S protein